jgi:ABC-type branched-subunit amino acid transport system substrate-binding protein
MRKRMQEGIGSAGARPSLGGRSGLLAGALVAVGVALGSPSCSFIVDKNADQCTSTDECSSLGLGSYCTEEKVCVTPTCQADAECAAYPGTRCAATKACVSEACSTNAQCSVFGNATCSGGKCVAVAIECTTNKECVEKNAQSTCRKSDGKCVPLTTAECTTLYPPEADLSNDSTFFIGSIFPTTGDYASIGLPPENAIKLAIKEFDTNTNGIPSSMGGAPRPLVLIGCNDQADDAIAVTAAKHLSDDLKLPAIIGAAFSGTTITITSEVTKLAGTLVISPAATSDAITTLDDSGLLWRTSPPDTLQATALAAYAPEVEVGVRTKLMLPMNAPLRVMIVNNDDSYGIGLGDALQKVLKINGAAAIDQIDTYYKRTQYTFNPTSYASAVSAITSFKPHIVYMFGFNEGVTDVFGPVEQAWLDVNFRPKYVFSDGMLVSELPTTIDEQGPLADDLRTRVTGTVPGSVSPIFNLFKIAYQTEFAPMTPDEASTFGAAGAYDATYLLAYATATLGGAPETGMGLAEGLKRMGLKDEMPKGQPVTVGAGPQVSQAFTILNTGKNIDFQGASGPLDFDPMSGEADSDIQIWCVPKNAMGMSSSGKASGKYYSALSKKLEGAFSAECGGL